MKIIKHLLMDLILWALLAICFFDLKYSDYAENIISFYGIFLLVIGVCCLFVGKNISESMAKDKSFTKDSVIYKTYKVVSSFIEITIVASMGWYWVAAGFLIASLAIINIKDNAQKIIDGDTP